MCVCVQASLETEARGRAELLRLKKKLEADLNELEIGLDHANKANMDAQKNLRIAQDHIKDLQLQLEDEIRIKNEVGTSTRLQTRTCYRNAIVTSPPNDVRNCCKAKRTS